MALESEVPVIPVAMLGTDKVNPIGSKMPRPRKVRVKIGEPLDFSRYFGMTNDRFIQRSMTDEIMYALMELSGSEYVDMYAAKAKEDAEAAARAAAKAAGSSPRPAPRLPGAKAS
jgi:1-acyl-sn-glycerol-3-phosphate acyltransferase